MTIRKLARAWGFSVSPQDCELLELRAPEYGRSNQGLGVEIFADFNRVDSFTGRMYVHWVPTTPAGNKGCGDGGHSVASLSGRRL